MMPEDIIIQVLSRTQDGQGGLTEAWTTAYQDVPARLAERSGNERIVAGTQYEAAEYILTVPWDQNIEETMRIIHDGVTYEVLFVNHGRSFDSARRCLLKRL
jgi:SPP1 family predicted phage head-tail adaptor